MRVKQKKRLVTLYVSIDNKQNRATAVTVAETYKSCILWRFTEWKNQVNYKLRKGDMIMIWIIKGKDLPTLEIIADSFDEALAIARKDNQNYVSGQVKE